MRRPRRPCAAACSQPLYSELGDYGESSRLFSASLTLYQRLGDRLGEAKVQFNLAALAEGQGRYADMLGHAEQALRLYQAIGDKASEAAALNNVGWTHGLLGDYEQARAYCRQALALCTEVGHHWLEGYVWDSLGYAEHHLGNLGEAAACYQRALSLHREAGDRFTEAEALTHLGETRQAAGNLVQAREAWRQALITFEDLRNHDAADKVRAMLASTDVHAPRTRRGAASLRPELPGDRTVLVGLSAAPACPSSVTTGRARRRFPSNRPRPEPPESKRFYPGMTRPPMSH